MNSEQELRDHLRLIEDRILAETGNEREKVVALRPDGDVLLEKTGTSGEIRLAEVEMEVLRDAADVIVHNHPSGGGIGIADFGIAAETNVRELVAFGDRYRYRLSRRGHSWPDLSYVMPILGRLQQGVRRYLQARVDSGTLDPAEASSRYWHEVWTRVAREVSGVHYHRELR